MMSKKYDDILSNRSFVFLLVIGNDHGSCKDVLLHFIKVRLLVFSNIRVMITVNSFATVLLSTGGY